MSKRVEKLQSDLFKFMEGEIKKGSLDKAVELAISCYFLSRGQGAAAEEAAISQIYVAFSAFYEKRATQPQPACSFCGRSGEGVKLAAGADAFICDQCVNMLASEVFKDKRAV